MTSLVITEFDTVPISYEVEIDDRTTTVRATASDERLGVFIGLGVAQCRKEDRFDRQVGMHIASGRALQALGQRIARHGLEQSRTDVDALREENASLRSVIGSVGSIMCDLGDILRRLQR